MQRENLSTRINKLLPDLLVIILLAAAVLYLALVPPAEIGFGQDLCLIKSVTHRACPGCGMTRAFSALLHGNLHLAIHFNPFILLVAPLIAVLAIKKVLRFIRVLTRQELAPPDSTMAKNNPITKEN